MTCEFCEQAERENPSSDAYTAGCASCQARIIAGVGSHLTPRYQDVLEAMFADRWEQGKALVSHWASLRRQHEAKA